MTHTPGPWEIDRNQGDDEFRHCGITTVAKNDHGGHETIATVSMTPPWDVETYDWCILPENAEANARLIAAAPEMLAALKGISSRWDDEDAWEAVEAAIAKATGGEP
jgi:hypothetical protein